MEAKQKRFYFKRFSLRTKFLSTAASIFVALVAIAIITFYYIQKTNVYHLVQTKVKHLSYIQSEIRMAEKNFLIIETISPDFYASGNSQYIDRFQELFGVMSASILELQKNSVIKKLNLNGELTDVSDYLYDYKTVFEKITDKVLRRGFKDFGLVGEMRDQIHYVEDLIDDNEPLWKYKSNMLMLRRHEKDYLLRKDLKYRNKFQKTNLEFITEVDKSGMDNVLKDKITLALKNYETVFLQVIAEEELLGKDEDNGLMKELKSNSAQIIPKVEDVDKIIKDRANKEISNAINTMFVLIGIFSLLIMFILFKLAQSIITSVKYLKSYIIRLGAGELPEKIARTSNDEISDMIESVNNLTENLKNTRDFAIEVGNGNFQTEINVFNNQGDLGSSLVDMRKRLLKVDKERAKQQEEERLRNWQAEGLAKFGDILRTHSQDMNELAYKVIAELVQYIEANQGGLFFLVEDEERKTQFLELKGAFAFDRRKYLEKRIMLNEGLVGRCAMEKTTTYMKDLPQDYIKITSGLGERNPNFLLIVPMIYDDTLYGVIELASFNEFKDYHIEFVEKLSESVASTFSSISNGAKNTTMLKELQSQTKEMMQQDEELRQNIEELQATREEMERKEVEMNSMAEAIDSTLGTYEIDFYGNITKANEVYCNMLGISKDEISGLQHKEFLNLSEDETNQYLESINGLSKGISFKASHLYRFLEATVYESFNPVRDKMGNCTKAIVFAIASEHFIKDIKRPKPLSPEPIVKTKHRTPEFELN